jgi:hypothetical protein
VQVPFEGATGVGGRYRHAIAYDSAREVVVVAGGWTEPTGTWEYDGERWVEPVPVEESVPQLLDPAMAYDSARQRTILFGGVEADSASQAASDLAWEYEGTAWTEVPAERRPRGRFCHGLAYDSARGVTVLFGGIGLDGDETVLLNDTWEYRPE